MSLLEQIDSDFKEALKNKDADQLSTLRLLKAEITNLEKEKPVQGKENKITDDQVKQIVSRAVKKRKEAINEFKKGGRQDLVQKEEQELEQLTCYLPQQLGEAEITQKAEQVIEKLNASSNKDAGKVMGAVMKELAGQADGKQTMAIIQKLLSS